MQAALTGHACLACPSVPGCRCPLSLSSGAGAYRISRSHLSLGCCLPLPTSLLHSPHTHTSGSTEPLKETGGVPPSLLKVSVEVEGQGKSGAPHRLGCSEVESPSLSHKKHRGKAPCSPPCSPPLHPPPCLTASLGSQVHRWWVASGTRWKKTLGFSPSAPQPHLTKSPKTGFNSLFQITLP